MALTSRSGGLYPLTSLQIGDIRSYVSRLFLLVAYEGVKLVFLVDNGPWTLNAYPSRPAELWQLLVYKSRGSPFVNRLRDYSKGDGSTGQQGFSGKENANIRAEVEQGKEDGWLSLLVALQRSCKEKIRSKKMTHGLHGCVAFEVSWASVRGINYSNELQTDTCMALEVEVMTKREFDSLEQARACYDTILSGSRDLLTLNVSKMSNGENSGKNSRGRNGSFVGLGPERAKASKVQVNGSSKGACASGRVEKKQNRKRKKDEASISQGNGSRASLISELSKGYIRSVTSMFGSRLDPSPVASLPPEYFTPPSSPYSEQVLHNPFGNSPPSQCKDSKENCIGSCENRLEPSDSSVGRVHTLKHSGECASRVGSGGVKYSMDLHSSCVSHRCCQCRGLSKCSTYEGKQEGFPFLEKIHCVQCRSSAEVQPRRVHIEPDRLIAVAETYQDMLILFRFSDHLLPLALQRIITGDRRLLKMLESGLPPWVIFLQSYPILCHFYRPWMRPLCRTVYYIMSIVTVLIGFYDLYKNVPVLKATAAHICGPLFEWIEEWGMVSRLKYLGTMLFLQNFEKAVEWAVAVTRVSRQISILLMRPFLQPLMWFGEAVYPGWESLYCGAQTLVLSIADTVSLVFLGLRNTLSLILWPFVTLLSGLWESLSCGGLTLVRFVSGVWESLSCGAQTLVEFVAATLSLVFLGLRDTLSMIIWPVVTLLSAAMNLAMTVLYPLFSTIWKFLILLGQLMTMTVKSSMTVKSATPSPSMWRTLWKDILSKVFHAVNGILKGLVAFFTVCNKHRLSTYYQLMEVLFPGSQVPGSQVLKFGHYQTDFWLPNPFDEVAADGLDDVEPESEAQKGNQPSKDLPSILRHRTKSLPSPSPLLLMKEPFGS